MAQKELEPLSRDECLKLLGRQGVGRLVYQDEIGPVAEPVNYAVVDQSVVLRIEGGSKRQAVTQPVLGFEVDHLEPDRKAGWSVIVRGSGEEVPSEDVPALVHDLRQAGTDPPLPWASGIHGIWLRIRIDALSGRKLGRESTPLVV